MSGAFEKAAANVTLPTGATSDTFPATGVNTGGMSLAAYKGRFVWLKATEACRLRANSAAVATASLATAGDMPIEADTDYSFRINKATAFLSILSMGTAGTLYVAISDVDPAA